MKMDKTPGLGNLPFTPEQLDELAAFTGLDLPALAAFRELCTGLGAEQAFGALLANRYLLSGSGCSTLPELRKAAAEIKEHGRQLLSERGLHLTL